MFSLWKGPELLLKFTFTLVMTLNTLLLCRREKRACHPQSRFIHKLGIVVLCTDEKTKAESLHGIVKITLLTCE